MKTMDTNFNSTTDKGKPVVNFAGTLTAHLFFAGCISFLITLVLAVVFQSFILIPAGILLIPLTMGVCTAALLFIYGYWEDVILNNSFPVAYHKTLSYLLFPVILLIIAYAFYNQHVRLRYWIEDLSYLSIMLTTIYVTTYRFIKLIHHVNQEERADF